MGRRGNGGDTDTAVCQWSETGSSDVTGGCDVMDREILTQWSENGPGDVIDGCGFEAKPIYYVSYSRGRRLTALESCCRFSGFG